MKYRILMIAMLCGSIETAFSQNKREVDSLMVVLKMTKLDTVKVDLLNKISHKYFTHNNEQSLLYAEQSLKLANKISYQKGISAAYNRIGRVYLNRDNYPEAIKNFNTAMEICKSIRDTLGWMDCDMSIGHTYLGQSNFPLALSYYFDGLKMSEIVKAEQLMSSFHECIGYVYAEQGETKKALNYYLTSLKINEKYNDNQSSINLYISITDVYLKENDHINALPYITKTLNLGKELGNEQHQAFALEQMGSVYKAQLNYPKALEYFSESLKLAERNSLRQLQISVLEELGKSYIDLKRNKEARICLDKSISIAKEIGSVGGICNIYYLYSKLDSLEGNYRQALMNYQKYNHYHDSVFGIENSQKLAQSQLQYNFDKQESIKKLVQEKKDAIAQKEIQKQKFVRNGFILGFISSLLFAFVIFIQGNKIRKAKDRSDELLLNILPENVAEELKSNGEALAKQFEEVTVMFTDFKDFTKISEELSPTELVKEIHTCFKGFDEIITKYKIEKIKTIGDSYMCASGLPDKNINHALDMIRAAVEIQSFMKQHQNKQTILGMKNFDIRIGIHTGSVVAGIVGVKKFAYDIWGDTVNIASRMESSSEPNKINISESTYQLVKDHFICIHRGKIMAKNKGEIDMYFIEQILPSAISSLA